MNIIVIKYGGRVAENLKLRKKFIKETININKKTPVVIVHGGGGQITKATNIVKIKAKFIQGLRYTDKTIMKIAEKVLSKINKSIAEEINKNNGYALGIDCRDGNTIVSEKIKKLGYVGKVKKINTGLLTLLLSEGIIPVIAPISCDKDKTVLNLNADTVATELAICLKAKKLLFLTDVSGILDRNKKIIRRIKYSSGNKLIKDKIVSGGMIPKLKGCLKAIEKGVKIVQVTDGIDGIMRSSGTSIEK